jgi:hypothetical protein
MSPNLISRFFYAVVLLFLVAYVEAGYRKPPFNGSIFGKRGFGM